MKIFLFGFHIPCELNDKVVFAKCLISALFRFLGGMGSLLFPVAAVRVLFLIAELRPLGRESYLLLFELMFCSCSFPSLSSILIAFTYCCTKPLTIMHHHPHF
jgi:hypothetical protein